jgi:simple sugar transport system permease protein
MVVIAVCLVQAPAFRARFRRRRVPGAPPSDRADQQKEQVAAA